MSKNRIERSSKEREALHKAIWSIAESVRGAVDGWDFKAYILCFLFYRFISEDLCEFIDEGEHAAGDTDFSYAAMSDEDAEAARASITEDKGYFILPSQLFCNVAKDPARDPELNIHVAGVFSQGLVDKIRVVFSTLYASTCVASFTRALNASGPRFACWQSVYLQWLCPALKPAPFFGCLR